MQIFQIGDIRLNLIQQEWHGYNFSSNSSSETLSTGKVVWSNTQYRPDVNSVTVEGYWLSDEYGTPGDKQNALNMLVGLPTQIFAYRNDSHNFVMWYVTSGILKSSELKEESPGVYSGSVEIEFGPYWYPLDRTLWMFSSGEKTLVVGGNKLMQYPNQKDLENLYTRWVRVERGLPVVYDPDSWLTETVAWRYPVFEVKHGWTDNIDRHNIFIDKKRWNAPPHSVYYFKGLNTTGSLTINVVKTKNLYNKVTEVTQVDLSELDTLLGDSGYTGLLPTDILIIGETTPSPGFVYRDGVVLNVVPSVTYPSTYPADLEVGDNTVYISGYSQAAWRHTFRRF